MITIIIETPKETIRWKSVTVVPAVGDIISIGPGIPIYYRVTKRIFAGTSFEFYADVTLVVEPVPT